jgi:hypothetical protein
MNKWNKGDGFYVIMVSNFVVMCEIMFIGQFNLSGFHKWRVMQSPFGVCSLQDEALWSAQTESTRKDIEDCFGIAKGRFRCLKLPILIHNQDDIDNMFFTCCILHNMFLVHDERDQLWHADVNWAGRDGDHDLEDEEDWTHRGYEVICGRALRKLDDFSRMGHRVVPYQHLTHEDEKVRDPDEEEAYYLLRTKLVVSLFLFVAKPQRED